MYRQEIHTEKFNTSQEKELAEYDKILNNPLCTVLEKKNEKLREEHYGDEGALISAIEHVVFVVTWKEKSLL